MENTITYRYPGVKPFAENEKHIFFGRDTDTDKLFKRIMIDKLTLLYAKSGLGKSSLLNAGVIPRIKTETDYVPVFIRFGAKTAESLAPIANCLHRLPQTTADNTLINKLAANRETLWLRLKKLQTDAQTANTAFLLVFDQFEELFTYTREQILDFKMQLAELLYAKIPADIRKTITEQLKENEHFFTDTQLELLYKQPEVKVIFSIRSDRMSLLNQLNDYLPDILKNYYELQALDRKRAEDALVLPAKAEGSFLSKSFGFAPQTVSLILDYLTENNTQTIETFQLQTICQFAEQYIIEQNTPDINLLPQHFGDLKSVFRNHYENLIGKIADPKGRLAARILIENQLIVDGNRVNLPDAVILKQDGMSTALLKYLHDEHHLLRSEPNTVGGISYELSHDTLVAPVLEAKKERETAEEEARAQAERAAEILLLKEKRRKDRRRLAIVFAALIFAIGLSGFALWQMYQANIQTEIADTEREKADRLYNQTEIANLKLEKQQEELKQEKAAADSAKNIAQSLYEKANQLLKAFLPDNVEDIYRHFRTEGDKFYALGEYTDALKNYNLAKNAPNLPQGANILQAIANAEACQKYQQNALQLLNTQKYDQAEQEILKALKLNPNGRLTILIASALNPTHGMVMVQGGSFMMGSEDGGDDEKPIHKVTLSSFEMSRYEVSNLQYAVFLNRYGANAEGKVKAGDFAGQEMIYEHNWGVKYDETGKKWIPQPNYEYHPVVYVTWYGANEYAKFYGIKLPTEAQWEYAAGYVETRRGVSLPAERMKYAGTNNDSELQYYAWYSETAKGKGTFPVGLLKPNPLGIYDLSGNVYEWCLDTYDSEFYEKSNDEKNPANITNDFERRVLRGGSWVIDGSLCRVSDRSNDPGFGFNSYGFRCVFYP